MTIYEDVSQWPLGDILPLSRPDPAGGLFPELGLMLAKRPLVVFLANAYEPALWRKLASVDRIEYKSAEELTAAGWAVD